MNEASNNLNVTSYYDEAIAVQVKHFAKIYKSIKLEKEKRAEKKQQRQKEQEQEKDVEMEAEEPITEAEKQLQLQQHQTTVLTQQSSQQTIGKPVVAISSHQMQADVIQHAQPSTLNAVSHPTSNTFAPTSQPTKNPVSSPVTVGSTSSKFSLQSSPMSTPQQQPPWQSSLPSPQSTPQSYNIEPTRLPGERPPASFVDKFRKTSERHK